jgi:hypothetical protein
MILELLLKLLTSLGAIKWTFGFSEPGVPVIPAAATWAAGNPNQSTWAGTFGGFPSPPAAAIATDTPDCPFNIPDSQTLAAAATYVPAPGRGVFTMAAFTTTAGGLQYNVNGTWTTVIAGSTAAATWGYSMFDGVNVRFNNLGSANVTIVLYRERSSKSTSI